ncbi:MAG: DNRLRE domain-containing protein [Candidatus Bathyarchaeia archaeon]
MTTNRIHIFREIVIVLVLSLVFVSSISIKTVNAQAGQVTLKPSDDTYVDSSNPNSNYGGQTDLEVEYWVFGSSPYQDIVWLKFDLSTIPNGAVIDGATLSLYTFIVGETFNVYACYCSDNPWTELGITWVNYPRIGFISVDSVSVATPDKWYNWNVSGAIKYTQDNARANPK